MGCAAPPPTRRRRLVRTVLFLTLVPVVYLAVTLAQVVVAAHRDGAAEADAIVVLGAAQYDGRPSPALRARLDRVIELWGRGIADTVVVTGGKQPGDRFTEATASATYLKANGIPEASILREVNGRSSWQSLADAAAFLRKRGKTRVVLVSDGYHATRIEAMAEELGLSATVSPVEGDEGPSLWWREVQEAGIVAVGRVVGFRRLVGVQSRVEQAAAAPPDETKLAADGGVRVGSRSPSGVV